MGEGLAAMMYNSGEGQNTKHYYSGTIKQTKKECAMCKKKPKAK